LKQYQSHKKVLAAKITAIAIHSGHVDITLDDCTTRSYLHDEMRNKPKPEIGWMLVIYENDYVSFSPSETFDQGYTEIVTNNQVY
jgi:hypothetical protein